MLALLMYLHNHRQSYYSEPCRELLLYSIRITIFEYDDCSTSMHFIYETVCALAFRIGSTSKGVRLLCITICACVRVCGGGGGGGA
eukprot:COSAG02_NODE_1207_length_13885_cov_124.791237_4_plen_86_part_00